MSDLPERKMRMFWAAFEGKVSKVAGYDCLPNSQTYWWVPSLGHSMMEGASLFKTKRVAIRAARSELRRLMAEIDAKLEDLARLERQR